MPEIFLNKLKKNIKIELKVAFISAIIIGFVTHMFVFTNVLPNHDGINNIYNEQRKFHLGRFFLPYFSGISSYFDLPWVNGSLSILYLALTSVVLTEVLKLRKNITIILTSGLIVTFPTIASTFSYMFTADGYMAGFLLAVLAILITQKYKWGFLPASIVLFFSVGIYQANLTLVLTVLTVLFITELIFNELTIRRFFFDLVRYVSMMGIGMFLYAILFKYYEFKVGVASYQGLNKVGLQLDSIMENVIKVKDEFIKFFFEGFITEAPINLYEILNVLLFLLIFIGIGLVIYINRVHLSPVKIFLAVAGLILLPLFAYSLYFVSPGVDYHMLMVMAIVLIFILPLVLYDRLNISTFAVKVYSWSTVIIILLTIFNFAIISNIAYFNMALRYEKNYAFVNRVLDRIEQMDGYENVSKIAVIGTVDLETDLGSEIVPDRIPGLIGTMGDTFLSRSIHYKSMLRNYFGKMLDSVGTEKINELKNYDIVKQMEIWPAESSVRIIGDTVIIRLE